MHQSEVNPALESEDENPHQSETQAMMNNMMQEPHSQRNLLQEMMNQQNRASRSEAASGRQTGRLSKPPEGAAHQGLHLTRPPADYVPRILVGAGGRGDSVGRTDSQLQSPSCTTFPNGGFSESSNFQQHPRLPLHR